MSAVVSTSTGRSYGGKRVCSAWGVNVTRSTFYAAPPEAEPARRGARLRRSVTRSFMP